MYVPPHHAYEPTPEIPNDWFDQSDSDSDDIPFSSVRISETVERPRPPALGDPDPISHEPHTAETLETVVYTRPCLHCFMPDGLLSWVSNPERRTCPMCRVDLTAICRLSDDGMVQNFSQDLDDAFLRISSVALLEPLITGRIPTYDGLGDDFIERCRQLGVNPVTMYGYRLENRMIRDRRFRHRVVVLIRDVIRLAYSSDYTVRQKADLLDAAVETLYDRLPDSNWSEAEVIAYWVAEHLCKSAVDDVSANRPRDQAIDLGMPHVMPAHDFYEYSEWHGEVSYYERDWY
jgi:hypothetical protein